MEIINRIPRMISVSREMRGQGRRLGLVPTRGALHEGQLALAARARDLCDVVILSVYVDQMLADDSGRIASDLARDGELAFTRGVDFIFAPTIEDMFPEGTTRVVVEGLSGKLEGVRRAGHFNAVTTSITRLLNVVNPHFVFLGRKDAQQVVIIKRMIRELSISVEPVVCPVVREEDGLALSSSNVNLSSVERRAAIVLHRALERCRAMFEGGERDSSRLIAAMCSVIEAEPLARIDYVAITDTERLDHLDVVTASSPALVSLAVYVGAIRLTDNIVLNGDL